MNTWRARASGRPVGGREQLHPCRLCSLTPAVELATEEESILQADG